MANHQVAQLVQQLVLPITQEYGIELVDVEFLKEGAGWYLRIYIDKPEGISHDDCSYVSERIDRLLDEKVAIDHAYTLEVSSPGIERPLKKVEDYNRFTGKIAVLTTFAPIEGQKKFSGCLKGIRADKVMIEIAGKELAIPFKQIASARLAGIL